MSKQLRTIVLVDSNGMASHSVKESWTRLHVSNPLRIFSTCSQALSFIADATASAAANGTPQIAALVVDHSAREQTGLQLIEHVRRDPSTESVPVLVYAADIRPLRECVGIDADAFVRRPMALKLIHELDSLCGLTQTAHMPQVGSVRQKRKEVVSSATHTHATRPKDVARSTSEH